jgi:hypothetical protein
MGDGRIATIRFAHRCGRSSAVTEQKQHQPALDFTLLAPLHRFPG